MAYADQDLKRKIAAALKPVVPAGWKYSLAVRNHSTVVMTINSAPFDILAAFKPGFGSTKAPIYVSVNPYHYHSHIEDECVAEVFDQIFAALNIDNYDNSDIQTDYFDRGYYVDVRIGRWDKPFQVTGVLAKVVA